MPHNLARRIVLCISIDCECDKGPGWRTQRPLSFAAVHDGIGARLAPLFANYHARATYLLSPELLRDAAVIERLAGLGDTAELGTHLHGELAEPDAFIPDVTSAFQRDYPEAVERAKLSSLTESFIAAFGYRPKSFRAGRFGIGRHTLGILADLGYALDSSVTPFVDWTSLAPGLSFVGAPTQPYRPDAGAPERRGASRLVEVPVTIRPSRLPVIRHWSQRWLRPTKGTARQLIALAQDEIAAAPPDAPVVLNMMFHNVEVIPGASPYAVDERAARGILARLEALLAFAADRAIDVIGLGDVPEILGEAAGAMAVGGHG